MNTHSADGDQQLLTVWLAAIGMLTMYWTPVERSIDQCVHLLYGFKVKQKKKPTKLGGKLDFIKSNMPVEVIDSDGLESLIGLTKATVQIRDVCVHGMLKSYSESEIVIDKVAGGKQEHHIEEFKIDVKRLNRSADSLTALQKKWGEIASALLKI